MVRKELIVLDIYLKMKSDVNATLAHIIINIITDIKIRIGIPNSVL